MLPWFIHSVRCFVLFAGVRRGVSAVILDYIAVIWWTFRAALPCYLHLVGHQMPHQQRLQTCMLCRQQLCGHLCTVELQGPRHKEHRIKDP
jgi:hypothetical protein